MRVLFMAKHRPGRAPSQRFRFEQYLDYLRSQGIECHVSFLLSEREDRTFYGIGGVIGKARVAGRCIAQRWIESNRAYLDRFDVVFVQREALFFGPAFIEARINRARPAFVFDFDDAIWVHEISRANRMFAWLKFANKTKRNVAMADLVIAGNPHLAEFARGHGASRVEVIPTTIDTELYRPEGKDKPAEEPVIIGWSGSFSTVVQFESALPALIEVKKRFGDRVRFELIGDGSYRNEELGIQGKPWNLETELNDLRRFDIGLMPLPDTPFTRGKCALKGLQYMALEIPPVFSDVGVNAEVVSDGKDGFLARDKTEWVEKVGRLVEDEGLRLRLGSEARNTVQRHYSVSSQKAGFLAVLQKATENKKLASSKS